MNNNSDEDNNNENDNQCQQQEQEQQCQQQEQQCQQQQQQCRPPNALKESSIISWIFFLWPYKLLKIGMERPLEEIDLPEIDLVDTSLYQKNYLNKIWQDEIKRCELINKKNEKNNKKRNSNSNSKKKKKKPSLHYAILKDFLLSLWFVQPIRLISTTARVIQAISLGNLIQSFEDNNNSTSGNYRNSWMWASILVGCSIIILFELHHLFLIMWRKGMQLRAASIANIYDKSLRLSSIMNTTHNNNNNDNKNENDQNDQNNDQNKKATAKQTQQKSSSQQQQPSTGSIINLATNDVERFILSSLFIFHLFWAPIQSIVILFVGIYILGPAFISGYVLLVIVFVPIQFYLSKKFALLRSKIAYITDKRVTLISQAIYGVRVMKMSSWEKQFNKRIINIRYDEIKQIINANKLKAINEAFFFSSNIVISIVTFIVQVYTGNVLTPQNVFTTISLYNIVQLELTKHFSLGVMGISEVYVSISRIQKFLQYPEMKIKMKINNNNDEEEEGEKRKITKNNNNSNIALSLNNMTCYWNDIGGIGGEEDIKDKTTTSNIEQKHQDSTILVDDVVGDKKKKKNSKKEDSDDINSTNDDISISSSSASSSLSSFSFRRHRHRKHNKNLVVALSNITLDIHHGELLAIIGTVGSGKSALIQAIVGELPPINTIQMIHRYYNTLSYACQDPWIMDGTVKENILMGIPYNELWYNQVIMSCGLLSDIQQFRFGDLTIVGDRGVQLSGGQRARIGLARALYRDDADIIVCDDPLSAVDAKVGRHIYNEAIIGLCINRGKCVILATHQHQYITNNDRCVLMDGGTIKVIGSYKQCVDASNGKLTAHHNDDDANNNNTNYDVSSNSSNNDVTNNDKESTTTTKTTTNRSVTENLTAMAAPVDTDTNDDDDDDETDKDNNNVKTEEVTKNESNDDNVEVRNKGLVRFETYVNYTKAMGGVWVGIILFCIFGLTQASALGTIAVIGKWAERTVDEQRSWDILGWVVGCGITVIALSLFRALVAFRLFIKASRHLHDTMTSSVLRARIEFFDTNPLGRILNRFSSDVGSSDDMLPQTLFDFFMIAFIVVGSIITTVTVLPFTLVALPPLIWYFLSVRNVFVTSTREVKRLEGLARSPIFAMMSESLSGIATIRTNNALTYFKERFQNVHDAHTRAFFAFIASSRWVGFRMDGIMFLFLALSSFLSVLFQQQNWFNIDPAVLGLALTMLLQLGGIFQWCVRQSAEVVNQMVSVERVWEFSQLPPEAKLIEAGDALLLEKNWPQRGEIDVRNLSVRYRSTLPLTLENVSFKVEAGCRVGVVGRTGSGKSTLVQCLFRLLEAEEGQIYMDNADIANIGLHTLRTKMSVIQQNPVLFSGSTVRQNLDPFSKYSDEEIHMALKDVHMLDHITKELPSGLNSMVSEGGSNFSVGQRQLLCLARAILCKNKILVLDEPTANVDRRTDQLLQEALQKSFVGATILSVAHRLDTVINYDRILVLGKGRVLEYGSPAELLANNEGHFNSMVNDTGEAMSKDLRRRAFGDSN